MQSAPLLDPGLAQRIGDRYRACLATTCDALDRRCSREEPQTCMSSVAVYTSCVTSCAAAETVATTADIRDMLDAAVAHGYEELTGLQAYLAGNDRTWPLAHPFVFAHGARCLTTEYFVPWSLILVPVGPVHWVPATTYVEHCLGGTTMVLPCNATRAARLSRLLPRVPVVSPAVHALPRQLEHRPRNPLASPITADICVAVRPAVSRRVLAPLAEPTRIKFLDADGSCPSERVGGATIFYERLASRPYYILPDVDSVALETPYRYCTMDQYASHLENQLFSDIDQDPTTLRAFASLWTRRADCMQTVLNLHMMPPGARTPLGATVGQAAGILRGLLQCEQDVSRAAIVAQLTSTLAAPSLIFPTLLRSTSTPEAMGLALLLLVAVAAAIHRRRAEAFDRDAAPLYESLL
ncbi:hypothetical protein ACHHYP_05554 [Achlya hypogyna]|uniref:Uncharacterized protein n=1 Tax=Achlya hypogyna TaxID=1202772 RepID=A0A1V9YXX0_ACHHY|nr:hypothetical protein ACHHYP_05554 [Achlya hypogyna]